MQQALNNQNDPWDYTTRNTEAETSNAATKMEKHCPSSAKHIKYFIFNVIYVYAYKALCRDANDYDLINLWDYTTRKTESEASNVAAKWKKESLISMLDTKEALCCNANDNYCAFTRLQDTKKNQSWNPSNAATNIVNRSRNLVSKIHIPFLESRHPQATNISNVHPINLISEYL